MPEHHVTMLVTGFAAVLVGYMEPATAGQAPATREASCRVVITAPRTGEKHGPDVLVTGQATVPANMFVWGFSHRRGIALVWPAGGGPAPIERGEYSILVPLGEPRDLGADFEIIVQVVDAAENAKLTAWFRQAESTGRYPGIPLPPSAVLCGEPPRIAVTKAR